MRHALRTGLALFNDGWYHAAHDAWEERWLALDDGTPDERFLHGLIQFTAAVYHLREANREGATGLAESALEYLDGLPDTYRDVDLVSVRDGLHAISSDEATAPADLAPITYAGDPITLEELGPEETWQAAVIIAEEVPEFAADVLCDAIGFAREEEPGGRFRRLLADFVTDQRHRSVIFDRLAQHVSRERRRRDDVAGLFDVED